MTASDQQVIIKAFFHEMRNCSKNARISKISYIMAIYIPENSVFQGREKRMGAVSRRAEPGGGARIRA